MKTRTMRKAALPVAALAMLGALLAGCSGGEADPSPSPSASPASVSDEDLGKALDKLVFQGTGTKSKDGGACLVDAVKDKGISTEGLAYIVERDSDDIGAVAEGLSEVSSMDAAILLSPELRGRFDACVDTVIPPSDGGGDEAYASPKPAEEPKEAEPNLTPKFEVREGATINSSSELTDGLVSMFSSYARDDEQKKTYEAAGQCLSGVVFEAGFSQETLRFLAGGAPIGTGSISDYLPDEADKQIWESRDFTTALVDCTANAEAKGVDA